MKPDIIILLSSFLLLVLYWISLNNKKITKLIEKYPIPEENRRVRLTWLEHCVNVPSYVPNPYIGMSGYVRDLRPDGSFNLQCETSWLIVHTNKYKFEYLD